LILENDYQNQNGETENIIFITGFHIGSMLNTEHKKGITPFQRFVSLLKAEKRDIKYIYFFAILIAIINLALPLGVQAIVGLISGGLLLESVIILIALVIAATGLSGYLQIQQLKMVEILQQRVFANVTFEFAWRLPRIKIESLLKHYTPEMVNRFFDVLNVQKSLPKILIDLTAALIQILFGLLLLSLYHPVFICFGIFILVIILIIFLYHWKKSA
jgi:ABC-type bacteriocin/lantibiotic exporter with double-glycine peptidase domain